MPYRTFAALVLALAFLSAALPGVGRFEACARDHGHSEAKPGDEWFGATSHRRFDDAKYWSTVFDDPKRAVWQKPVEIVAALDLQRGTTVADLGAGTGYFLAHLLAAIGAQGTVYAVEVEPNLVVHLRERAQTAGWQNVIPVLASNDNPRLPAGSIDIVLIVDTYHHLDDRRAYLGRLTRALSKRGRIAIVDWKKGDFPEGPDDSHKLSREQVAGEMEQAGFRLVADPIVLPYQYMLIYESASPNNGE